MDFPDHHTTIKVIKCKKKKSIIVYNAVDLSKSYFVILIDNANVDVEPGGENVKFSVHLHTQLHGLVVQLGGGVFLRKCMSLRP